jgi:hypothetical protein
VKNIRQKTVDFRNLKLSPEEGFVLSRVDGTMSLKDLIALTGLDEARVAEIVGRLADEGALEVERDADSPATASAAQREREREREREPEESAEAGPEVEAPGEEDAESSEPVDPEAQERERRDERNYRQLYETIYHPMDRDRRLKAASEVEGADLLALCLDADPQIVTAVLANPHAGLDHARMIAQHHRTQIGLEGVAKRSDHLKDAIVQRRLLQNPLLPTTILHRIVNPKMMMEVYKTAIDREIPERSRMLTREALRKKFMLASSDEKASLLFKTEGRCLAYLVNCSLDAHATQILCGKSTYTNLFIQNFARWSATPPALLAHLVKLPVVRHNQGLRKMLLKHPNMPGEAKRSG